MQGTSIHHEWFEQTKLKYGATKSEIEELQQDTETKFPPTYLSFLEFTDGYEGWIGESYVNLWSTSELIRRNKEYGFAELIPGYFAIGSDGGGESFGFETHSGHFLWFHSSFQPGRTRSRLGRISTNSSQDFTAATCSTKGSL